MLVISPLRRRIAGRILMLAGVVVWGVYAVIWFAGGEPEGRHYLLLHLSGVIPGALLARWDWIRSKLRKDRSSTPG